jgi:hypothetical protein
MLTPQAYEYDRTRYECGSTTQATMISSRQGVCFGPHFIKTHLVPAAKEVLFNVEGRFRERGSRLHIEQFEVKRCDRQDAASNRKRCRVSSVVVVSFTVAVDVKSTRVNDNIK